MKIIEGSFQIRENLPNPVLTLGNFDGIHLGHQAIMKKVRNSAQKLGGISIVYTFDPHPVNLLAPEKSPPEITSFREKVKLVEECGIEIIIRENFTTTFAGLSARDFVNNILHKKINVKKIIIGNDYRFGKGREGNISSLKNWGEEFGFEVEVVGEIKKNNIVVKSSKIREFISEGEMEKAAQLLGRNYFLRGKVVDGKKRGKGLGFPTANLAWKKRPFLKNGVYAVWVFCQNCRYAGVASIGFNPTFKDNSLSLEVHILDFNENIYHEEIELSFVKRLRGEKRFSHPEKLADQIKEDILGARKILNIG